MAPPWVLAAFEGEPPAWAHEIIDLEHGRVARWWTKSGQHPRVRRSACVQPRQQRAPGPQTEKQRLRKLLRDVEDARAALATGMAAVSRRQMENYREQMALKKLPAVDLWNIGATDKI